MASAIATGRSDAASERCEDGRHRPELPRRPRLPLGGSRLGRLIVGLNLVGLVILIFGVLVLNEFRRGLIDARADSLRTQADLISYVIVKAATVGEPDPRMNVDQAVRLIQLLNIPSSERARLYDAKGHILADTDVIADKVMVRPLGPARKPGLDLARLWPFQESEVQREQRAHAAEQAEVKAALSGQAVQQVRPAETGGRLVSVSVPIQYVQDVLGVLTIETGGVDQIVAAQRAALTPFILIAVVVSLFSSFLLNTLVARPVMRLARAADMIRLKRARILSLPDIAERDDEIGDLTKALEAMTTTLSDRMDATEAFAADVSHEIKNPLTSIRSAVETLEMSPTPQAQARLLPILKHDVGRLDRLITDIANASRLDAELSREAPRPLDLAKLLADIAGFYQAGGREGDPQVRFVPTRSKEPTLIVGRESPLGQVFRNLIDNARSFSPQGGTVTLSVDRGSRQTVVVTVEDEGPGVPPENLESIFERFYTERPRAGGAGGERRGAFGGHSGLGLSIARQIVETHAGAIRAENRTGEDGRILGARFVITLPAA
jgi:two-component system sensor histidine kinase ChvG